MSFEEEQEQVERIYIDMENRLLLNIAKKIARGKPMEIDKWDEESGQPIYGSGGVNEWQLERLKELNGLNKENAKIIASYSKKTVEEIEKIFDRAREIGTASDKRILEMGVKAGILNEIDPTDESKQVKKIIKHAIREVLTTFNKQNNSLLASAGEEYKEIVNTVSSKVLSGNKTVGSAIQEAISRLAEKGLTGFTARNGAEWTPEAYTKMIMRTNTQNTINNIQEERLALAGNDYIEISKHSGARPKCADDQGQIFSLSGNTKPIVDGRGKKIKVRAWSSSSYGKPDGILGINCGHTRYAFVPNLSIHREPEFTKAENDADYLEKQQQRLYERSIRKKKREIQMLEEIKADKDYIKKKNNQLRDYRKEYTGFLNKTGRTRISSNEWVGTLKSKQKQIKPKIENKIKWFDNLNYQEKRHLKEYISSGSYKINEALYNHRDLTEEQARFRDNLDSALTKVPKYKGYVNRSVEINSQEQLNTILSIFNNDDRMGSWGSYISSSKGIYDESMQLQFVIKSKNGRDLSSLNGEGGGEILFERKTKFKYIDFKNKNGKIYVSLEEVE